MSTIAYAQLTNLRAEAPVGKSTTSEKPGMKTYIDAVAALVPAEVLSLHALVMSYATKTQQKAVTGGAAGAMETVTTILPEAVGTVWVAFWVLFVFSVALYIAPRISGGKWDRWDYLRAAIAPAAFVSWTMMQRATAFDAVWPALGSIPRTISALFAASLLGVVATGLAMKVDAKAP